MWRLSDSAYVRVCVCVCECIRVCVCVCVCAQKLQAAGIACTYAHMNALSFVMQDVTKVCVCVCVCVCTHVLHSIFLFLQSVLT